MNTDQQLEEALRRLKTETPRARDERILRGAAEILTDRRTSYLESNTVASEARAQQPTGLKRLSIRIRVAMSGIAAALIAIMGIFWFGRTDPSWAQVTDVIRAKPWVYIKGETPDGTTFEEWLSSTHTISARRDGQNVIFKDHRMNVQYNFDAQKNILYKMSDSSASKLGPGNSTALDKLFEQIIRGDESLVLATSDVEIVEQGRREIALNRRKWIEYEMTVRPVNDKENRETGRMVFRVDPGTKLPVSMTVTTTDPQFQEMTATFSFPDTGPADPYALGVPKDAKLVDLVPKGDLKRLTQGIAASSSNFDHFFTMNVITDGDAPWYDGTVWLAWQQGKRTRLEVGLIDAGTTAPPNPPQPGTDKAEWWKERAKSLWYVPVDVCDGKTLYLNRATPPGWTEARKKQPLTWPKAEWPKPRWKHEKVNRAPMHVSPLVWAYPKNAVVTPRPGTDVQIDEHPQDGPAGSVLMKVCWSSPSEERFWIDPERTFLVVRDELWNNRDEDRAPAYTRIVDASEKSPRGYWYPTRVRHILNTEENGRMVTTETRAWHFLSFNVEMPDELFKPVARETTGTR